MGQHAKSRIMMGLALAATLALSTGIANANDSVARTPAQSANSACMVNGKLIAPKVDNAHTYGWAFVANFDQAASTTQVRTCLAERELGLPTQYRVENNHCAVTNNTANAQFGGGVANFDGNAYLVCSISVRSTRPTQFWVRANVIPNAVVQSYTFLSSSVVNVTANTGSSCSFRPSSQYTLLGGGSLSFTDIAAATCGSYVDIGSRLNGSGVNTSNGWHVVSGTNYSQVSAMGRLELPATFAFNIGAAGQPYTMDWLVIDPTPSKSGGS
jgi:hypothetical protein